MKDSELSVEHLQAKIEAAFSAVSPPSPDNLVEHDCQECRDIKRNFQNENWRDMESTKVEWAYDKFPLFTPDAFHYYLPAFMIYSLRDPESKVCEFLFYALASKKSSVEWWKARLDKFTEAQKAACKSFLSWLSLNPEYAYDVKDINRALERWWKTEEA